MATPGHTANHLAFAWPERKIIFVGDHVMGWSTSIVAPPDGSMIDYMASLERLAARDEDLYFSGHGPEIPEGPRYVRFLIRHRQAREASILHRLAKGEADIPTMVRAIYIGIDPRLIGAAGYSVLAHLEDLVARGIVATDGDPVIGGTYRLASRRHSEWRIAQRGIEVVHDDSGFVLRTLRNDASASLLHRLGRQPSAGVCGFFDRLERWRCRRRC